MENLSFPHLEKGKQGIQNFKIKRIMCVIIQKYCHRNQLFDKTRKNERHCKKLISL